jgi:arginine repressor
MEYFLIHKDQPTDYLLIGTQSFDSFWPDQGLRALMNIVEKTPEALTVVEIKTSSGAVLTISEFLDKIKKLRVRSNG